MESKELKVLLETEVGLFKGNFDEVKRDLQLMVSQYNGMVYTEDNEKMAREDAAKLRKLRKFIDEKRLSTKKEYMKPAEHFDAQCKELMGVVDLTIEPIAKQCDEFDKKRRGIKKEAIFKYFQENVSGLEEYAMFTEVFHEKMLNVNYTIKQYKEDINNYITKIETDVKTLQDTESEFAWKALEDYKKNKDLAAAFKTITLLEEQKREILEKERRAREEEERKKEEARRLQEEAERRAREKLEQERLEAERKKIREEEERKAAEEQKAREEAARIERDRLLAEQKAEFERKEAERIEREKVEAEERRKKEEADRLEREQLEAEIARQKAAMEAEEKVKREQERIEQERLAKEKAELEAKIAEERAAAKRYKLTVTGMTKSELFQLADVIKPLGYKFTSEEE